MKKRLVLSASVVVIGAVALACSNTTATFAAPSAAAPRAVASASSLWPSINPQVAEVPAAWMATQVKLDAVASKLNALVDPTESGFPILIDGKEDRFSGLVVHPNTGVLDLYWSGNLPAAAQKIVDSADDVKVVVHSTPYSLNELQEAGAKAADFYRTDEQKEKVKLIYMQPAYDGTGVTLVLGQVGETLAKADLTATATAAAGLPVNIKLQPVGSTAYELKYTATRQADVAPWFGGANLALNGTNCSSGFSVVSSTGNKYLTTGYHCIYGVGTGASGTVKTGAGVTLGTWSKVSTRINPSTDTAFVDPASNTNSGRVYGGSPTSSTSIGITSAETNSLGDYVITDGMNSGQHSQVEITQKNGTGYYGKDGTPLTSQALASRPGYVVNVGGDSGGPVIASTANGVGARGMIVGSTNQIPCGSTVLAIGGQPCYDDVLFVSITRTLSDMNSTLAP
jgi:hypothetical protein